MPLIDFYLSNDGHHAAMLAPVAQRLGELAGYRCRIISLCEFRGIRSPVDRFAANHIEFVKILPQRFRSPSSGGSQGGSQNEAGGTGRLRRLARVTSWQLLLKRPIRASLTAMPDLVVLPNDAAFPYDCIVQELKLRQIPFILVQEGIRFPLPSAAGQEVYGRGGAAAIAVWGESSAAYFRRQGVPDSRLWLTGNPRFDTVSSTNWPLEANKLKEQWCLGQNNLLFLSNPIDDQGFCSSQEKLDLIYRFVRGIGALFDDPEFHLIIKLHGRESVKNTQAALAALPQFDRMTILGKAPLYPLFALSQAAVIMASTVGLEALLFGLPLAVLEIPRTGYVHDYVSSGAATGLCWNLPMSDQVNTLLAGFSHSVTVRDSYLENSLAERVNSTGRLVQLIGRVLEGNV
jgi:hypothetical protein